MGWIFIVLHIVAILFGFWALIITIPLHLIYISINKPKEIEETEAVSDDKSISMNINANKLKQLNKLKEDGHKLIHWTSRGEPVLQEAIDWCSEHNLEFDDINVNPFFDKESGPSPKIVADYYIDDKALEFKSVEARKRTINFLEELLNE